LSRKKNVPVLIDNYLDKTQFDYTIAFTEYAGHATELAAAAVKQQYDIVVAVGGDGSINEVADALIGTSVQLGILPGGSGNGFAMHLGWGRSVVKAKESTLRGLYAYTKFAILEAWSYPIETYTLIIDGEVVSKEAALVIEVANAQMFGYNFVIAPQAKLNDGILDVLVVKKVPKWRYLFSLWRFFNRTFHQSSLVQTFSGKHIQIQCEFG